MLAIGVAAAVSVSASVVVFVSFAVVVAVGFLPFVVFLVAGTSVHLVITKHLTTGH